MYNGCVAHRDLNKGVVGVGMSLLFFPSTCEIVFLL